jgi:hypothetical protein
MITVRQIERLWNAKTYAKLFRELMSARPEASLRLETELQRATPVAALAVIRLDELSQSYVPLCGRLIQTLLTDQQADGGWGDPMTTALCLRALLCSNGQGWAIDLGMKYLSNLQKSEGIWPAVPLRRMPADPYVSAFILMQLGDSDTFRKSVRFTDAVAWFDANKSELDPEARKLWDRATQRCGRKVPMGELSESHLWS